MTIDRRTFLKLTSYAGLTATGAWWLQGSNARAQGEYRGPFFVTIHAGGGWDPTMLCDPKGRIDDNDNDPVNNFWADDILDIGPFRVAPVGSNQAFFQRFQNDLLVINGIDTQTNSHEAGTRHTWSGSMDSGMPSFSALAAAVADPRPALSFLSNGGYDETAGLVPPTRIPDVGAIQEIAFPEALDASNPDNPDSYLFTEATRQRIRTARAARHDRGMDSETLPRVRRARNVLNNARAGENELAALTDFLPGSLDNSNNRLFRQAQVAMACFKAGVTVSANLSTGGFDTHGNHDQNQGNALRTIVDGVTYLMDEAERQGIADQVVVLVGSDFGRTPWYNDTNGKDHWTVTSFLAMGPGISGGRVVGATDEYYSPLKVNADSLAVDESGMRIRPGNIHASLRELAGIADNPSVSRFAVGARLPLFG